MKTFFGNSALIAHRASESVRFALVSMVGFLSLLAFANPVFAQQNTDLSGVANSLQTNIGALGGALSAAAVIAGIALVIMGLIGLISDNPQKSKASAVIKIIIGALLIGITAVIAITQGTILGGGEIQQGSDGFFEN